MLLRLRQQLFTFGARRLTREFDLPLSHRALEHIWRQHGLLKKHQRKYQRKQDLAHIKATWRVFQQISADTKDLNDIPRYWPQAQAFDLPAVEYTAREVRSGLLFRAFAQRRSAAASSVFVARIQLHLERCGISLRDLVWQTDNGSEFIGGHDRRGHPTGFPSALGDSQHVRIPPAAHTFQNDVETVHRLTILREHVVHLLQIAVVGVNVPEIPTAGVRFQIPNGLVSHMMFSPHDSISTSSAWVRRR